MKKFLSMVLALIMVLSMFTVGAGAVDFDDFVDVDEIQYKAAVEVMTELGILSGYDNGYFSPNGTISRGAAAKILAYIALGETKAEALTCVESAFSDVAITSSVAPYVNWVAKEGIAIGYDDGTFGSKNAVSGHAYLKMVLGAMGVEGKYEGDGWRLNVTNNAAEAGLFEGIDTTAVDLRGPATRELACQIAFNAMFYSATAKSYQYTVWTETDGDNVYEAGETLHYKGTNSTDAVMFKLVNAGSSMAQTEVAAGSLGYKNYGLAKTNGTGEFDRPSTVYTSTKTAYNTLSVAAAKTPVLTYANGVKAKALWTALGYTKTTDEITLNVVADGDDANTTTLTYKKGDSDFDVAGKGAVVEVYKTETAKTFDVIVINTYVETLASAEVKAAVAATATTDAIPAYIKVTGTANDPEAAGNFKTDAFKANDVILYTIDETTIKSVAKATKVPNVAVEKYTLASNPAYTTNVTINGVTLSYNATAAATTKETPANFTDTFDFYLDAQGNIIYRTTATEAVSKDYVYVTKYQARAASSADLLTGATTNTAVAEIITIDGVKKTVDLKITKETVSGTTKYYYDAPVNNSTVTKTQVATTTVDSVASSITVGDWFAYVINEDGTYTLKAINADYASVVTGPIDLDKGIVEAITTAASTATKYTNSKTTVTAIDKKQVITSAAGLVDVTLTGKVLVTYTKASATTISAIYAVEQATASVASATEYVYALKSGAVTSKGTEWTFAVDGEEVTYVVGNPTAVSKGGVYTLSVKSGVATATAVTGDYTVAGDDYVETNVKVTIVDEEYIRIESYGSTLYLADKFATYCVETGKVGADTLVVGDIITVVLEKQLNGTYEAVAAFITVSK